MSLCQHEIHVPCVFGDLNQKMPNLIDQPTGSPNTTAFRTSKSHVPPAQSYNTEPGVVFRKDIASGGLYAAYVRANSAAALARVRRCVSIVSLNNVPATRLSAEEANTWVRKLLAKYPVRDSSDASTGAINTSCRNNPLNIVYGKPLCGSNTVRQSSNTSETNESGRACDQLTCLSRSVLSTNGTHFCNACAQGQSEGCVVYGCRVCDWDLCNSCYLSAKQFDDEARAADEGTIRSTKKVSTEWNSIEESQEQNSHPCGDGHVSHQNEEPPASVQNCISSTRIRDDSSQTSKGAMAPLSPTDDKATKALQRVQERRKLADARRKEQEAAELAREEAIAVEIRLQVMEARAEAEEKWCAYRGGRVTCADKDIQDVPECVQRGYHTCARILDISFNKFSHLDSVSPFEYLEELIVDNNNIQSPFRISPLKHLRGLSLNNNNITDMADLVKSLQTCPKLRFLSLLRNPICPDLANGITREAEYDLYRSFLIVELPRLRVLDSQVVTGKERRVANSKFEYSMLDEVKPLAQVLADVKIWMLSLVRKVQGTRVTPSKNTAARGVVVARPTALHGSS
eukprot:m.1197299 g.1197299  ORF g.1197299 m.1197299 type:complete len:571 (-) comp24566_c0_seq9:2051-3763(-)